MATYAFGDLHGEAALLREVLAEIEPLLEPKDTLLFLGDYLDRGPDVRGVIDELLRLRDRGPCRFAAVRGNHEEWFLETWREGRGLSWLLGMQGLTTLASYDRAAADGLRAELFARGKTLFLPGNELDLAPLYEAFPREHVEFLAGLPAAAETADVIGVHGGADPGAPWAEQEERNLIWGAPRFPDAWEGPQRLAYGHRNDALVDAAGRASPRVNPSGRAFGLDASASGVLLCVRFPDLRCFQASRRAPPPPGGLSLGPSAS